MLNRVIEASAAALGPEELLETVCRELALAFNVPQAAAALLNEEKTEAVVVAEYLSKGRPTALNHAIPVADNPSFQYLLEHRRPLAVEDAQTNPRLAPIHHIMHQRGVSSLLILPLTIKEDVVGSLGLDAIEPRSFSIEEVNLAWSVADQVAGVLDRARLTQTHQHLITAIEQTTESVVITDTEGAIIYVNPAFEQNSGYSRAEVAGQNPRILKSYRQGATFYQALWDTITSGQVWHGRFINKKKDGNLYTEDATITPILDEDGAIVNYVAVKRNVTRELQLEEQYHQAQKMEAIGRLASGVAHDFNNLLTAIMGHSGLALRVVPPDNSVHSDLEGIKQNAERAAGLTRQLLAFARKQVVHPIVLNLNDLALNLDKMLRRLISEDIE